MNAADRVAIGEDPYLPLKALAAYAGMSVRRLRTALTDPAHPLPHYRPGGGKIVVRRSDFDRWMARFRREGPDVDRLVSEVLKGIQP